VEPTGEPSTVRRGGGKAKKGKKFREKRKGLRGSGGGKMSRKDIRDKMGE